MVDGFNQGDSRIGGKIPSSHEVRTALPIDLLFSSDKTSDRCPREMHNTLSNAFVNLAPGARILLLDCVRQWL
jgi:hypothetical protein